MAEEEPRPISRVGEVALFFWVRSKVTRSLSLNRGGGGTGVKPPSMEGAKERGGGILKNIQAKGIPPKEDRPSGARGRLSMGVGEEVEKSDERKSRDPHEIAEKQTNELGRAHPNKEGGRSH